MTQLLLQPVERHDILSTDHFFESFFQTNKPVVFRNFSQQWPAFKKWTYDYLKSQCGGVEVPLFDGSFAGSGNGYLEANTHMLFGDYLDLIQSKPTHLRMFLFNIFKHLPELCHDFDFPNDINVKWLKKFPFVFFGGEGSYVDLHYDLDHSHVFLTQFQGIKRVILFAPEWSTYLYRHPLTVSCNINLNDPDFNQYPRLADAQGYEVELEKGGTLFIPSRWWHYIYYKTGGFSLSLRAMPDKTYQQARGLWSIAKLRILDQNLSRLIGHQRWYHVKEGMAQRRAKKI